MVASGLLIIGSGESRLTEEDGGLMLRVLAQHRQFVEAVAQTESVWVKLTDQGNLWVPWKPFLKGGAHVIRHWTLTPTHDMSGFPNTKNV